VSDAEMEYKPLRKYPTVTRDISLVSQNSMRVDDLLQAIQDLGGDIVLDADLFDMFDFTDGSTSYAFHVMLGADDRTLNGAEIEETMGRITKGLEAEHGMQIRQ
ncbi:MAG: phenylalanyl-tRNA synthetase subunit beta, partial [Parcubacteria group bacterium GW2011_GWC1_45_14]